MDLKTWTSIFIKNRDLIKKELDKLEVKKDSIDCFYSDREERYIIKEHLDEAIFDKVKKKNTIIVCENKKKNVIFVYKKWKNFLKNRSLRIIFSNPEQNEKWVLRPSIHDRVTDKKTLKKGLISLYESVSPVK
ncbi:hypothetical protein GF327_06330 [Candidatus Woesearchaeota archaeon]|nr:hypothetical protein [Candidatus Woesearchaeota archaeon]